MFTKRSPALSVICSASLLFVMSLAALAQQFSPALFQNMRWRMIGPFRGGRTVGATGVRGQPSVFYIGVNNGGVWRTTDYGRTWTRIATGIAPEEFARAIREDPEVKGLLYAGTERGVWLSLNDGRTWQRLRRPPTRW